MGDDKRVLIANDDEDKANIFADYLPGCLLENQMKNLMSFHLEVWHSHV